MDARLTLMRDGVAAASLEGIVEARNFLRVRPMRVGVPRATLRSTPDAGAEAASEVLYGEAFEVLLQDGEFAFGQNRRDGYVGFVASAALIPAGSAPTHRISAQSAPLFSRPDIKAADPLLLPRNALVRVTDHDGRFARIEQGGFIVESHLAPAGVHDRDFAAVALDYLGAPYLWGGRSSAGLDCSGLVQQAMTACGRFCPRDSDQQRGFFSPSTAEDLRRGDLVFWPGHVAMLLDGETMIHANAHHMRTAVEPLADAVMRIGTPTAWRRP
jgi:cell wall-associated NlpC family hydrolase